MKQIFTTPESPELELLKNVLEAAGIPCTLKNEQLSQALPAAPFNEELWVLNDADYPAAQELCENWVNPATTARENWVCLTCGQPVDGQFDSCWKCGGKRESPAASVS